MILFYRWQVLGTDTGWPYLLGFGFVVAMLQLFTLPFCPRSPRYLLLKLNKEPETVEGNILYFAYFAFDIALIKTTLMYLQQNSDFS